MSDDDLIRLGDVLLAIHDVADFNRDVVDAIRALPAVPPSPAERLTFDALRRANLARLPEFRDRKGRVCHVQIEGQPVGFDWSLSQWSNAVCGELGEAANLIKKIERGDMTLDEARSELADEICDVVTYLDILAHRAGIDMGEATIAKWNRVSERVGSSVRLAAPPAAEPAIEDVRAELSQRGIDVAPAVARVRDALARKRADEHNLDLRKCPNKRDTGGSLWCGCREAEAEPAPRTTTTGAIVSALSQMGLAQLAEPAKEPAPCGTCWGSGRIGRNTITDGLLIEGRKPCPSCRPGGAA